MLTYSSCFTCGGQLSVYEGRPWPPVHDGCPLPTDRHNTIRRAYLAAIQQDDTAEADRLAAELDAIDDAPPQLLAAALTYASWGWPVFPCRPGLKMPASAKGVIEHGLRDATTDRDTITAWWRRWPRANIGLPTGHAFDVIDIDPAGIRWWVDLLIEHADKPGPLPDIHGITSTPRPGGQHVYIAPTGDGNLAGFVPGVDYRGAGGYVLAPPSVLTPAAYGTDVPEGRLRYLWHTYPSPALKSESRRRVGRTDGLIHDQHRFAYPVEDLPRHHTPPVLASGGPPACEQVTRLIKRRGMGVVS